MFSFLQFYKKQLFFISIICFSFAVEAQEKEPGFTSYWDKGFHLKSNDGDFKIKFGGRLQFHTYFLSQDDALDLAFGPIDNGSEIRRARFYSSGTLYKFVNYKLEFDFSSGFAEVTDAYVTLTQLPIVGNLQVGHFKEPFSLDMMNSSNDITFMERAPVTAIKKQRNNGLMLFNTALQERATWAIGAFNNTTEFGESIQGNRYNFTARVTGLPYFIPEKNHLLHLGLAYSQRNPVDNIFEINSRPATNFLPAYVDTGDIENVTDQYNAGAEVALVLNSFSTQAEYITSGVTTELDAYNFSGYYVETSYFLTGEHKNYSQTEAHFKRVTPQNNFNPTTEGKGWGAWEVALRYSSLDLNDAIIAGGELTTLSAAVNWYLNPATRISLNYNHAMREAIGDNNIVQCRFQIAF